MIIYGYCHLILWLNLVLTRVSRDDYVSFVVAFRDSQGIVLMSSSKTVIGDWDVDVVEAHAMACGLSLALDICFHLLVAKSDRKCLIDKFKQL